MNPSQTKRLVLCADDYALEEGVSTAILNLARQGRLTATSAMVLSPRWAQDAAPLRELAHQLDVGLHLDWTSDFAKAAGYGGSLAAMMTRSALGVFDAKGGYDLVREVVERQLDAFEAHWQRAPDHVDGHQHVHQFAGIRQPLLDVLQRRYGGLARQPWLRISQVAQPGWKARIISAFGARAMRRWTTHWAWPQVSPLIGAYNFDAKEGVYAQHMSTWLRDMPELAALMCHPAQAIEGVTSGDAIYPARVRECAYLQSEAFAQALQAANVRLVRGSQL